MPNVRERDYSYVDEWKSLWEPDLEAIAYNGATCDPTRVDPKVLQWVRENCAHMPHFIKVINEAASYGWRGLQGKTHCKLGVPRPFVRDHYKELGRVVTLESGVSHGKWKVSFGAPKKNSSWLQGWRRVADDSNLKPGDVMIFILVGHSHFRFHLFDEDGNFHNSNPKQNDARAISRPSDISRSHQKHRIPLTDSEEDFKKKKLPRLFDPDLAIVKLEPGLFQPRASSEDQAPSCSDDHRNEQILEPALCEKSTVPGRFGTGTGSSPDSELTVTDHGEETISRGESVRDRKSAPNTGQRSTEPQIALNNVDTLAEKSISTATCHKTLSGGSGEGSEEGPVKRKLEFETTKTKPVKQELSNLILENSGMVSQLTTSFDQVQAAPPQGTNLNPPAHELPINPFAFVITSRRRMTTPTERKRARDVAKAHAEVLIGFRFVVVMSGAQVYRDFHLPLPGRFVAESRLPTSLTRLSIVDSAGKPWEMYSKMNSCNEVAFNRKYWGIFALEHFLEEDDVCLFQLKNTDTLTISVRIFRVLQLPQLGRNLTVHEHYQLRPKTKS